MRKLMVRNITTYLSLMLILLQTICRSINSDCKSNHCTGNVLFTTRIRLSQTIFVIIKELIFIKNYLSSSSSLNLLFFFFIVIFSDQIFKIHLTK